MSKITFGSFRDGWRRLTKRRLNRINSIAWVLEDTADVVVNNPPPSPREQIQRIHEWSKNHKPEYTNRSMVAPRWEDGQTLNIPIPEGLTRDQKRSLRSALVTLCNTQVIGMKPKIAESSDK